MTLVFCIVLLQPAVAAEGPCEFGREFAPAESIVKPQEEQTVTLDGAIHPWVNLAGVGVKAQVAYFSFWIRSPRGLDDLLAGGPDAPRAGLLCYVSEQCRVYLNGAELQPARTEPADYRTLCIFSNLPLKKGWNHCLVKVAAEQLQGEKPGTIAMRLQSDNAEYLRQLESAIEIEVQGEAKKQ